MDGRVERTGGSKLLRRWRWLLVGLVLMGGLLYLSGYRLTPVAAAGKPGKVIARQSVPGGQALLLHDGSECVVALTRRWGPFWQSFGWSECGFENDQHPFSWAGRGSCTTGGRYCIEAIGGMFTDPRIAVMRHNGVEQDVSAAGGFLFVERVGRLFEQYPSMQALDANGVVLYEMHDPYDWKPAVR